MSGQYRLVRLNTRDHNTRQLAIEDMTVIVERGGYWTQHEDPPDIPVGTELVGMGSYGGRGLYLHGIVGGEWDPTGEETYLHMLPVTWAHVIYELPDDPEDVGALVSAYNSRSWSQCSQPEFRAVLDRVLAGRPLPLAREASA